MPHRHAERPLLTQSCVTRVAQIIAAILSGCPEVAPIPALSEVL
jgi:hypothetical protein